MIPMLTLAQPASAPAAPAVGKPGVADKPSAAGKPNEPFSAALEQAISDASAGESAGEKTAPAETHKEGETQQDATPATPQLPRDLAAALVQVPVAPVEVQAAPAPEAVSDAAQAIEGDAPAQPVLPAQGSEALPVLAAQGAVEGVQPQVPAASVRTQEPPVPGKNTGSDDVVAPVRTETSPVPAVAAVPVTAEPVADGAPELAAGPVAKPVAAVSPATTQAAPAPVADEAAAKPADKAAAPVTAPAMTTEAPVAAQSSAAAAVQPAPPSAPAAGPAPVAPAAPPAQPTQAPLPQQISSAIAHLRTAPTGEHVMVVRVHPEELGPVRVTAVISPDGVRLELAGATEQSREALRAALSDLRRELASTGLQAELQLTSTTRDDRNQAFAFGNGTSSSNKETPEGGEFDAPVDGHRRTAPAATPSVHASSDAQLDLMI